MKFIFDILTSNAREIPSKEAYVFLEDGEQKTDTVTYTELEKRSKDIAQYLKLEGVTVSKKVLLLFSPGIDYITAFFGCICMGCIPVPAYPPRNNRHLKRLKRIIDDSDTKYIYGDDASMKRLTKMNEESSIITSDVKLIYHSGLTSGLFQQWIRPNISVNDIAFLQYTSGSTGEPKGVMVTHKNLYHNELLITDAFEHNEQTVVVGWLPLYHDMGLIGNVIQPLFVKGQCILMSPFHFVQKPIRWLQAISKYRGTTSGAPNFAFQYCIENINETQLLSSNINLESWSLAYNGSEPIQNEVIEGFIGGFSPWGFKEKSMYPCYGLAEGTLMVSGGKKSELYDTLNIKHDSLLSKKVEIDAVSGRKLVSSGCSSPNQKLAIVGPYKNVLNDLEIGEICVAGESIAAGYWNNDELTRECFQFSPTGHSEYFLRTGDLGFIYEKQLYVTGRIKDLIIIRGKNFYPNDIEREVELLHPAFIKNGGIVFSQNEQDGKIVLVQEINHRIDFNMEEAAKTITQYTSVQFGLKFQDVVFVPRVSLPKTSSGKKQRLRCHDLYNKNLLNILFQQIKTQTPHDESIT